MVNVSLTNSTYLFYRTSNWTSRLFCTNESSYKVYESSCLICNNPAIYNIITQTPIRYNYSTPILTISDKKTVKYAPTQAPIFFYAHMNSYPGDDVSSFRVTEMVSRIGIKSKMGFWKIWLFMYYCSLDAESFEVKVWSIDWARINSSRSIMLYSYKFSIFFWISEVLISDPGLISANTRRII